MLADGQELKKRFAYEAIEAYKNRQQVFTRVLVVLGVGAGAILVITLILLGLGRLQARESGVEILATDSLTPSNSQTPPPTRTSPTPAPPTVTRTLTPLPSMTPTPTVAGPLVYVVKQGDTLLSIAEDFDVDLQVILAVNDTLTYDSVLAIGQEILIPPDDIEFPTATSLPDDLPRGFEIEYIVLPGDTIAAIAAKFNSTIDAIVEKNELEDASTIELGRLLIIPSNLVTPTESLVPAPSETPAP